MELRFALCSLLTFAAFAPAQESKPAAPVATPAAQDPDKPTPKPADLINDLTREKERLQSEIEFARSRAKGATKMLGEKLAQRGQTFRGIDAGTNTVAPAPVAPMKKARLMSPDEAKAVNADVMVTVNGMPIHQAEFDGLMAYLRSSPATGDDSVRAQRILFELIRTTAVAAAFPENEAEGKLGDVVAELEKGKSFAELVKTVGTVQGANEDGRIEITRNSYLGPKAEQIAFSLPAGQRSRPFRSAQGYVVLQCESVEKGTSPELDKVIAHALQVSYVADPAALQRAQAAAASGQVDLLVRDQQVMDMLPVLFRAVPPSPVGAEDVHDSDTAALADTLAKLRAEADKLKASTEPAAAERLKQVLQAIADTEQALKELSKQGDVPQDGQKLVPVKK